MAIDSSVDDSSCTAVRPRLPPAEAEAPPPPPGPPPWRRVSSRGTDASPAGATPARVLPQHSSQCTADPGLQCVASNFSTDFSTSRSSKQVLALPWEAPVSQVAGPDFWHLLVPLERDWMSSRLGFIVLRRRNPVLNPAARPDCSGSDFVLHVFDRNEVGALPLGRVRIVLFEGAAKPSILFEEGGGCGAFKLVPGASRRRRVAWRREDGLTDVWDAEFLHSVKKAAESLKKKGMLPYLEECLPTLSRQEEASSSPRTVGLCTATMNRLWQLRVALPLTLLHCWKHRRWTRVHVVDFGSTDGTLDFLLNRCQAAIDCGLLRVYRCDQQYWHASIAKNTAHMVAEEDILVNVDGDNIIGPGFIEDVLKQFQEGYTVVQYEYGQGTCGRIAYSRQDFVKLNGYDEDAYPMGAQDTDIVLRLKALPHARVRKAKSSQFSQAIPNTNAEKVANCDHSAKKLRWGQMDTMNQQAFQRRRNEGQLVRNLDRKIGVPATAVSKPVNFDQ
eukprot:TRINITY_DN27210_c0_g1_i1.p1 TRINITY_DN27210_c0_g1~~TRINITY_DN27210_c0_g1_i1.p1  ORF type:complete len:502 (-),score=99.60 TRINITY_DN27210_c0_g1_i1:55-1560(-)